ncbi:MAG: nitrogenase component 1, partial [Planctomycetota bacterium]
MASSVRPYSRYLPPPLSDFTGTLNVLTQIPRCFCLLHSPHGCAEFYDDDLTAFAFESDSVASVDLDQHSVIHGAEERVEQALLCVDRELGPRVIALVASPVSALIGTDLEGVARKVAGRIRAKIAVFPSGGIKGDWWEGERDVYAWFAREIVEPPVAGASGVNLIGASYSIYNWRSDSREIHRTLEGLGIPVIANFSIEATLDDIARAGTASLSLVLDAAGLAAARILEERFGIPFLAGLPFGLRGTEAWLARLGALIGVDPEPFLRGERRRFLPPLRRIADVEHDHLANRYETFTATVMGNGVYSEGLARFLHAD